MTIAVTIGMILVALSSGGIGIKVGVSRERRRLALETEKKRAIAAGEPDEYLIGVPQRFRMLGYVFHEKRVEPRVSRIGDLMMEPAKPASTCKSCSTTWHHLYEFINSETPGISRRNALCDFCPKCGMCTVAVGRPLSALDEVLPRGAREAPISSNLHDLLDLMDRTMREAEARGDDENATPERVLAAIIATKPKALPATEPPVSPSS